jgi:hypothetical protein
MDIVLLGLAPPQQQHLASTLSQALSDLGYPTQIHLPIHIQDFQALPQQARILLCASSSPEENQPLWRELLFAQGLPFQVVHGQGENLLEQCLLALLPPNIAVGLSRQELPARWQGVCEACGDPDCEKRLFSGLLQGR